MIPKIEDYKILNFHQTYFVLDPYDLFTMPQLKIVGPGYISTASAREACESLFQMHMREYNRLKEMGRSFPDND